MLKKLQTTTRRSANIRRHLSHLHRHRVMRLRSAAGRKTHGIFLLGKADHTDCRSWAGLSPSGVTASTPGSWFIRRKCAIGCQLEHNISFSTSDTTQRSLGGQPCETATVGSCQLEVSEGPNNNHCPSDLTGHQQTRTAAQQVCPVAHSSSTGPMAPMLLFAVCIHTSATVHGLHRQICHIFWA